MTAKPDLSAAPPKGPGPGPSRARRALSHVGGELEIARADASDRQVLERALAVEASEAATMAHVHGFHSYPARLHPATASALVAGLSQPGQRVLDAFCGSGTVLVESRLLGRRAFGVDANPLAIELAWLKTRGSSPAFERALSAAARSVVESADARRERKLGATRRYGPEDQRLFDMHVLLELDGLRAALGEVEQPELRRALLLVLSSLLTKVSRSSGDTGRPGTPKRIAAGFATRFFGKKTQELVTRLRAFSRRLPERAPEVRLAVGDARRLERLSDGTVELVVSSPPYPGVYDYFAHHESRLRWLGLATRHFEGDEIGARRRLNGLGFSRAVEVWEREFGACLSELGRVLTPRGTLALVIADSVLGGRALYAVDWVERLAAQSGLALVASAWQARPYFHAPTAAAFRGRPRREHVLLLRHGAASSAATRAPRPKRRRS